MAILCFVAALVYLPLMLLAPSKFAMLFTLGSVASHCAVAFTYANPLEYVQSLISRKDNLLFVGLYFLSVFGTLYSALGAGSYMGTVVCSSVQFGCVIWFFCSYIPGGTTGLRKLAGYLLGIFKRIFV